MGAQKSSRVKNLTYVALAGQAGCVATLIVLVALVVGLWLDSRFGRKGPFTVGLLVLSVPFCLFIMTRLALRMVNQLQSQTGPKPPDSSTSEEE